MTTEPGVHYYRNYNENDSTGFSIIGKTSSIILSYDSSRLNFSPPEGKVFKEWNTARDGSGVSYSVGESFPGSGSLYAIWEQETPITYYVTGTELTAVADAIRTKGDTSEALEFPDEFVSAIEAIETGGSETLYIFSFAGYTNDSVSIGGVSISPKIAYFDSALVAGTKITFKTYNHYALRSVTGMTSGDSISFVTVSQEGSQGTYTFTMPNESVLCNLFYND